MSHEFRTPLHGILSFSRFGRRRLGTVSNEKLLDYFVNIEECSTLLLTLVNELLDLAKLESGRVSIVKQLWDLTAIIDEVMRECDGVAEERGIALRVNPHHRAELQLDRDKIGQVVRNLLSNAIKASPRDSVIAVHILRSSDSVTVRVEDQGPGIPDDELESIFGKFIQSSRTNRGAGGTGLGLAICRDIVALHDGRIWAENRHEGGAAVCFALPRQSAAGPGNTTENVDEWLSPDSAFELNALNRTSPKKGEPRCMTTNAY